MSDQQGNSVQGLETSSIFLTLVLYTSLSALVPQSLPV